MSRRERRRATKGLPRQTRAVEGTEISIEGSSFATPIILRGDKVQNISLMVSTHPDDDHRNGSEVLAQAQISRKFYGGGLPIGGTADGGQHADHRVFISFNHDNLVERASRPSPRQQVVQQLPIVLAIPTLLLSKDGRDEVLADLLEWYDELAKTRGIRCARFFVAAKLLSAIAGQALKITDRIAGIVSKVWGRQKG